METKKVRFMSNGANNIEDDPYLNQPNTGEVRAEPQNWTDLLIDVVVIIGLTILAILAVTAGAVVTGVCLGVAAIYAAVTADGTENIFERPDDLLITAGIATVGAGLLVRSTYLVIGGAASAVVGGADAASDDWSLEGVYDFVTGNWWILLLIAGAILLMRSNFATSVLGPSLRELRDQETQKQQTQTADGTY